MTLPLYNCRTARFDGTARALTEDEMRAQAPSIFAQEAHASRSDRFRVIPTYDVVEGLGRAGFFPVACMQSKSRDESKRETTKHLIRFRHLDDDRKYKVGDTICEINLKNANDGTSQYELFAGLYRIRCLNSLVSDAGSIESVKVRHSGDPIPLVIEGAYKVLDESHKALEAPAKWGQITVKEDVAQVYARAAALVRFGEEGDNAYNADALLQRRRSGDNANDLWTVTNVIQENAIRGGVTVYNPANVRGRYRRARAVTNIDQNTNLNRALWRMASQLATIIG